MSAAEDMVHDLLRPEAYPPPTPSSVGLEATHISWVFLTENRAWKVKRPVNFGFVDFSSPDQRRFYCEEEIRLNSRLAADVYLGVEPVRLGAGGYSFVGEGKIVDHAVKMRRLPAACSARAMILRQALTPGHLVALADRLARFYADAPESRDLEAWHVLRDNVEGNLTALDPRRSKATWPLTAHCFETIAGAQRRDLGEFAGRCRARRERGLIREGHGDLRLEHVYFPDAAAVEPVVIDAVEFSDRFRIGDTALDVAFLAMELEAEDRPDLAEYFFYRYARASDDYDAYPLLDFYVVYRALVRAKVAGLLAADPTTPADKVRRKEGEASRLIELAYSRACGRSARPAVITISGLVGAGKSTLAETLAERLGVPVVSSDLTRKRLAGVRPATRGSDELYSAAKTIRTYEELFRRADLVLGSGRSIVLDATFARADLRHRARAVATAHNARFVFIEATCDEQTLRARLLRRAQQRSESDADIAILDRMRATYEQVDQIPPAERLTFDTHRAAEELVAEVKSRLDPRNRR